MKGMILALAVAGALMLAGCGGGSKSASMAGMPSGSGDGGSTPTTPGGGSGGGGTPTPIALPTGHTLQTGTIPAGESRTVREADGRTTTVTCSGGEACSIRVAADRMATLVSGSLRVATVERVTSGTIPLPMFHALDAGTIPAGESRTVRAADDMTTLVRCSAGGGACSVMVAEDAMATATLASGSLRVETQSQFGRIALAPPTSIPGGGTMPVTWDQLPSLVDRMDYRARVTKEGFPAPIQCDTLTDCQSVVKSLLAAATEPTGTRRRFQGTRTLQTVGGVSFTDAYWGGWLDNSIFVIQNASIKLNPETGDPIAGIDRSQVRFSMGIRDRNPVTGVYRGEAVDREGNWGTSELNYVGGAAGGSLGLTINIPVWPIMRWPNVPVDDRGRFNNNAGHDDNGPVGPQSMWGSFYQGDEVGGVFNYKRRPGIGRNHSIFGAFGAKRTP